jgi:hypothetical protein
MTLVASRRNSSPFSADEDTFANSLYWKNLLLRACSIPLWEGERSGKQVAGSVGAAPAAAEFGENGS